MFADYLLYLEKASNKAKDLGINDLPWNSYWVASAKLALRDPYCHTQPQLTTMGIQTRTSIKKHSKLGKKGSKNTRDIPPVPQEALCASSKPRTRLKSSPNNLLSIVWINF